MIVARPANPVAFWFCLLLVVALSGCATSKQAVAVNAPRTVTDELGRQVAVAARPQRIVSLAPSVTESLFALGLGERTVGVTSYCDFPEEAKAKTKVGDTINPNLERILALRPDLVVITTSSQLQSLTEKLGQLSIPVYVVNPRTVREVIASLRRLGVLTDTAAKAEELASEMERRVGTVEQRVARLPRPRVLYLLQNAPLITAGRATFINDLIQLAGGASISGNEATDYPQFSREAVVARAPEVMVVPSSHGSDFVRAEELRRDFAATPALKTNRIVRVDADWVDRPGPRIVDGLEQLAQGLHPESP